MVYFFSHKLHFLLYIYIEINEKSFRCGSWVIKGYGYLNNKPEKKRVRIKGYHSKKYV